MDDNIFNAVIKEIVFGRQFICAQTNEDFYNYLEDDYGLSQVNNYLRTMHRVLRKTAQGDTYYCCYLYPNEPEYKSSCRAIYTRLINDLNPFLKLITTVMSFNSGSPIRPGDILKEGHLLTGFEQSKSHCESLKEITRSGFFASTSTTVKGQLTQVLKKLSDDGYLMPHGHSGTQYRATGKWSMLYDFIDFQYSNELIEDDDLNMEQMDLA